MERCGIDRCWGRDALWSFVDVSFVLFRCSHLTKSQLPPAFFLIAVAWSLLIYSRNFEEEEGGYATDGEGWGGLRDWLSGLVLGMMRGKEGGNKRKKEGEGKGRVDFRSQSVLVLLEL